MVAEDEYILVGEHTAFGGAGSAAGVQQEEKILRYRLCRGLSGVQFPDIRRLEHRTVVVFQYGEKILVGQQHPRVGVLHHEGQPLGRVRRVQREICATGLDCAQRGYHHVFVAPQHDAHHAFRRHLGFDVCGQVIRQQVDLPICQTYIFVYECKMVRSCFDLMAEGVQNGLEGRMYHCFSVFLTNL